jgi:hypothetical protein
MPRKKRSQQKSENPIEVFRRSLGLSYDEMAVQLGLEGRGLRLRKILSSRESLALIPSIRERWGVDLTSRVIESMDAFFSELLPVEPEEWMKTKADISREEERYAPARDPYDPEDDLEEMVSRLQEGE